MLASSSGSELSQESEQLQVVVLHASPARRPARRERRQPRRSGLDRRGLSLRVSPDAARDRGDRGRRPARLARGRTQGPRRGAAVVSRAPRPRRIELPAALEGKTLVEDKRSHTVVAETYKAKGAAVRIAVAPGEYEVIVRHGTTLSRCEVASGRRRSRSLRERGDRHGDGEGRRRCRAAAHADAIELGVLVGARAPRRLHRQPRRRSATRRRARTERRLRGRAGCAQDRAAHVGGRARGWQTMPKLAHSRHRHERPFDADASTGTRSVAAMALAPRAFGRSGFFTHFSVYAEIGGRRRHRAHVAATTPISMTYDDTHFGPAFGVGAGLPRRARRSCRASA